MKILVSNHWLKKLGGSETFTYTLAGCLVRLGHKVDLFTLHPGTVSNRIVRDFGVRLFSLGSIPKLLNYDLILANHVSTINIVARKMVGTIIQTCHGVFPKLEQPNNLADKHVAISPEVRDHLKAKGFDAEVIYNGVDLQRFKPESNRNKRLRRVLSLSHNAELNHRIRSFYERRKISVTCHSKYNLPKWHVERLINTHDLVITLGRGCYESLACGRPVLVLDHRDKYAPMCGDGFLTGENIERFLYNNCSGRAMRRTDVDVMLQEAIELYDTMPMETCRGLAERYFDIEDKVKSYLQFKGSSAPVIEKPETN